MRWSSASWSGRPFRVAVLGAASILLVASTPASAVRAPAGVGAPVAAEVTAQLAGGGQAPFWVLLKARADLSAVDSRLDKAARGAKVVDILTRHADRTQAGLRNLLARRGVAYQPFWITDAILVTGDRDLLAELRLRPEVSRIEADTPVPEAASVPAAPVKPVLAAKPATGAAEWNIARVGANRAWQEYGVRGEGIVVASIDTGARFDHPALFPGYRGRNTNNTVDHGYSMFEPFSAACVEFGCDFDGHGTHVTGIMVGHRTDGGPEIGVAPAARWIAADAVNPASRLAAAQWLIAPTDAEGANPRYDLAPDVVNNSWISSEEPGTYFRDVVEAWIAAGIFPVFAAGNSGGSDSCSTNMWPASLAAAYAVGNATRDDEIARSSSRGPTADGRTKPDIAAPGTDIRSSGIWTDYRVMDGTSQAAPHVAGAVALLWSAVPSLQGDGEATRRLLDDSARNLDDTRCGGTVDDNNSAGEGLLDIPALLSAAPQRPVGGLAGQVRQAGGGALPDARVVLTGPKSRTLTTDAQGRFGLDRMVPGTYSYRAEAFGHRDGSGTVTIAAQRSTPLTVRLEPLPSANVTGVIRSAEGPEAAARVAVVGTAVMTRTDVDGRYSLRLPLGAHKVAVTSSHRCAQPITEPVTLAADVRLDLALPPITDQYGYTCTRPVSGYEPGATRLDLSGTGGESVEVALPFPVSLYGVPTRTAWVSPSGAVGLAGPVPELALERLERMPDPTEPNAVVFPFYSRLNIDADAGVYLTRSADQVLVEWRNVQVRAPFSGELAGRLSISLVIRPDSTFTVNYRDVDPGLTVAGRNALIGLESENADDAFIFGNLEPVVADGLGFTIRPPS